jgi:plastocyanin
MLGSVKHLAAHRHVSILIVLHSTWIAGLIVAVLGLPCAAQSAAASPPTTQPSGTVKGTIASPGEVPLPEMVVYLQPDDNQPIPTPTETVRISQKGAKFSPAFVVISVGQTVDFANDEDRPIEHNVFSNSAPKQFDLGVFKPGESRAIIFDKPGPVFLYCSIHRYMDGVIYVAPTPYFSRVNADGSYKIDTVPVGHWVVRTWQRRRRYPEAQAILKVTEDQISVQDLALQKP